jgi:hypothetical protein
MNQPKEIEMNDAKYRAEIDALRNQFGVIARKSNVGIVVPAAMEIVLSSIMAIGNKEDALRATKSLRPMIDYIEGQLRGLQ